MASESDVKAYHHRKNIVRLVRMVLAVAYAALWCWLASLWIDSLAAAVGSGWAVLFILGATIFLVEAVLFLPLGYYTGYVLEHRYDLSNEDLGGWLWREVKEVALGAVLGAIVLAGLYGLLWYGGSLWWLWVWLGWMALAVGLTQLFPIIILPIFYKAEPLEDETLVDRLHDQAEGSGIELSGVYRLGLSEETKKPNAMLTGLGSTRRVLLSDTLLDAFSAREIETVFVHELGHHARGHIWKGIALSGLAATLIIAGIVWRLGPHQGGDIEAWSQAVAALPEVMLVTLAVGFVLQPATNALMRRFETDCDRDALEATGPTAYRSAFEKLADMSMADPEPARIVEIFFYDHPPIGKRLALADGVPERDEPAVEGGAPGDQVEADPSDTPPGDEGAAATSDDEAPAPPTDATEGHDATRGNRP